MRLAVLGGGIVMALAGACGGGASGFPEEAECPAPAPIATSRATPGTVPPELYLRRVQTFSQNLDHLRANLRAKYPEDTFYRREEFRPDFADYASQTVCTAEAIRALSPPDGRYAEYDSALDLALADLIEHTRLGREAVRSRNVSEYRQWFKNVDTRLKAVNAAAADLP
jgi:hypothetical protein